MAVLDAPARTTATPHAVRDVPPSLSPPSRVVVLLSGLVAVLATIATVVGIFSWGGPGEHAFTTVRGETVQLFGHGIYRYETLFQGAINLGTDFVTLILGVPVLLSAVVLYRSGSLRGRLLLTGILSSFAYVYANMALGAAYNSLYLVYVALFSASAYALVITFRSVDLDVLESRLSPGAPRRFLARFLFVAGAVPALLWLSDIVGQLLQGGPPVHLDAYTTSVTYTLDLAIITPACFVAGLLVVRNKPLGYALAFPLIGIIVMLVPGILASTVSQLAAGVTLSPGEIIGPVAGFIALGLVAVLLLVNVLRSIADTLTEPVA